MSAQEAGAALSVDEEEEEFWVLLFVMGWWGEFHSLQKVSRSISSQSIKFMKVINS